MSRRSLFLLIGLALIGGGAALAADMKSDAPSWSMNASIIEACSCPMFCQCYFNSKPSSHAMAGMADEHYCRFNNAFKVNRGSY
jgi:hypothetical protein